jgi:hypothetical protein
VQDIKVKSTENQVSFEWKPVPDAVEYVVYRDEKRVAVLSDTEWVDVVPSDKRFRYKITAVDLSCNEAKPSAGISVTTKDGGDVFVLEEKEVRLSCESGLKQVDVDGVFELSLDLLEGKNNVVISGVDRAGNSVVLKGVTTVDVSPPRFLETNLDDVSPTYLPEIIVKGEVSEPSSVLVFVNDESKPSKIVATDLENKFEARIRVKKDIKAEVTDTRTSIETIGWTNTVRIVAMDAAGRRSEPLEQEVKFNQCGSGTTFSLNIDKPLPDVVTPRLMLNGIQQIGFPFNLTYRGTHEATIKQVKVGTVALSRAAEESFDHDWVSVNQPLFRRGKKDFGFVQLYIPALDEFIDAPSTSAKEIELSGHEEGSVSFLVLGV